MPSTRAKSLAEAFQLFAEKQAKLSSPLYLRLAAVAEADPTLLRLAAQAPAGQPRPVLFFAAIHYLLAGGAVHPLARHYPDLDAGPPDGNDPAADLKDFCLTHIDEIALLLRSRRVQTNEVRRCGTLMPALEVARRQAGGAPLAVVDVGCSAGLNLLYDRFHYDYGNGNAAGDPAAPVKISTELRGDLVPPLPEVIPPPVARIGLDIHPIDINDDDAVTWLRALIWPEHADRRDRLMHAVAEARVHPLDLRAGDALELLPALPAELPADATLCITHSHALNQFSPEMKARFDEILAAIGRDRPVYRVGREWDEQTVAVDLEVHDGGRVERRRLATSEGHGRWMEWLDRP